MTKTKTIARPWQGTLLAIFNIIELIPMGILIIVLLLFSIGSKTLQFANNVDTAFTTMFGTVGLVITFGLSLLFVLGIFIIKGIFKGQKWTITVSLIFSILGLLSLIKNFHLFSLFLIGFAIYLEIACLLHPFYNEK